LFQKTVQNEQLQDPFRDHYYNQAVMAAFNFAPSKPGAPPVCQPGQDLCIQNSRLQDKHWAQWFWDQAGGSTYSQKKTAGFDQLQAEKILTAHWMGQFSPGIEFPGLILLRWTMWYN
jgi:hypothetical protein